MMASALTKIGRSNILHSHLMDNFRFSVLASLKTHVAVQRRISGVNSFDKKTLNDIPMHETLDFEDWQHAFRRKRTLDILRALCILKLSSFDLIVDNADKIIKFGRKVLGKTLFDGIIRWSIYRQFVGGSNIDELRECVLHLHHVGIRSMLAVPIEEDVFTSLRQSNIYNRNLDCMVNGIKIESFLQPKSPITQIRMTALTSAAILVKISKIYPNPLTYSELIYKVVSAMESGKKLSIHGLTSNENMEINDAIRRLVLLGEIAEQNNVMIMIDAECSYINPAITVFALSMMLRYNMEKPLICNTYQCYLKKTLELLKKDMGFVTSQNRFFGLKLVRGAYLYREKEVAHKEGYPVPVHDTAHHTSNAYNEAISFLVEQVANDAQCAFMIASHNEKSVQHFVKKLQEYNIEPGCGSIYIGQLYGMCDHVSYTLGQAGYPIYKSIPYGEIDDTIPYLIRRAQENRSIIPGARRERELLRRVLRNRFTLEIF